MRPVSAGGGIVLVSTGKYAVARLELRSNVTVHLNQGAILLGSRARKDFAGGPPVTVFAREAQHIAVEGEGAINGQMTADYGSRWARRISRRSVRTSSAWKSAAM